MYRLLHGKCKCNTCLQCGTASAELRKDVQAQVLVSIIHQNKIHILKKGILSHLGEGSGETSIPMMTHFIRKLGVINLW